MKRGGDASSVCFFFGFHLCEMILPALQMDASLFTLERRLTGAEACVFTGFRVVFWSRFVSVRRLDSGELLMSTDRVRHGVMESKGPLVAISNNNPHAGRDKYGPAGKFKCETAPLYRQKHSISSSPLVI